MLLKAMELFSDIDGMSFIKVPKEMSTCILPVNTVWKEMFFSKEIIVSDFLNLSDLSTVHYWGFIQT